MKKAKCPFCLGTGEVQDQAAMGALMKSRRRVSLRELSRRMGVSYPHLSLLERGKRRWNLELVNQYKENCL